MQIWNVNTFINVRAERPGIGISGPYSEQDGYVTLPYDLVDKVCEHLQHLKQLHMPTAGPLVLARPAMLEDEA